MEDLPLGRIAAFVPKFAVKDLPLGRTLMMVMMMMMMMMMMMELYKKKNYLMHGAYDMSVISHKMTKHSKRYTIQAITYRPT